MDPHKQGHFSKISASHCDLRPLPAWLLGWTGEQTSLRDLGTLSSPTPSSVSLSLAKQLLFSHPQTQDGHNGLRSGKQALGTGLGYLGREFQAPSKERTKARPSKAQVQGKNLIT